MPAPVAAEEAPKALPESRLFRRSVVVCRRVRDSHRQMNDSLDRVPRSLDCSPRSFRLSSGLLKTTSMASSERLTSGERYWNRDDSATQSGHQRGRTGVTPRRRNCCQRRHWGSVASPLRSLGLNTSSSNGVRRRVVRLNACDAAALIHRVATGFELGTQCNTVHKLGQPMIRAHTRP